MRRARFTICDDCGLVDVPVGRCLVEDRWGCWWGYFCGRCQVLLRHDPDIWSVVGVATGVERLSA